VSPDAGQIDWNDATLAAEIGCPLCGTLLARVGARRNAAVLEWRGRIRSESVGVVVTHLPRRSQLFEKGKAPWFYEAWCSYVRCEGWLVLEVRRVQQLLERAIAVGAPIRWRPTAADVARSEALLPLLRMAPPPAQDAEFWRTAYEIPPLSNVRRIPNRKAARAS
jgi:hypothetical protein